MKKYHLLQYVENSSPKTRKFKSIKALKEFIKNFQKRHRIDYRGDNWLDFSVTNITGNVQIYDESITLELEDA